MAIIITKNGKDAKKVDKIAFEKENALQKYIYENPDSIPLYDIKEDIRLLILAREFPTNSGSIDAIGIDQYGELYIVETKLYKNPDKRTVIAQALDYGAALWKHSDDFNEFFNILDEHSQKVFGMRALEKSKEFFQLPDEEMTAVIDKMRANLNGGVFHFVVLMDKLEDRLKDLILYVNQNSQFDIYAVELEYYKHDAYEIIIPKIFGAEVKKDIAVSGSNSPRKEWTETELMDKAQKELTLEGRIGFEKLFKFSKEHADSISLGTGSTRGSFGPVFNQVCPRTIFTVRTNGIMSFNYDWINGSREADLFKEAYFKEMGKLGFAGDENYKKFPRYDVEEWASRVDDIINVLTMILK